MNKQAWNIDKYYNLIIDEDENITLGNYLENKIINGKFSWKTPSAKDLLI